METTIETQTVEKLSKLSSDVKISTSSVMKIASSSFLNLLQSTEYFSDEDTFGKCEKCKSALHMIDLPNGLPKIICKSCSSDRFDLAKRF
ncbi:MAG: hypothetical protein J0L93_11285 [Deltaproteobacteria bacterium]|nr:hypothetical protein [Deltaproteobacteria bacterium]